MPMMYGDSGRGHCTRMVSVSFKSQRVTFTECAQSPPSQARWCPLEAGAVLKPSSSSGFFTGRMDCIFER